MTKVLITGGSSGIGLETARGVARRLPDAEIWVTGRNEARLDEAVRVIRAEGAEARWFRVDFSSLADVRRLADEVSAEARGGLDVLINNAGLWHQNRRTPTDGFEDTFAVNHLAPFLLTLRLMPRLLEAGRPERRARVVTVSSRLHERPKGLDLADLADPARYEGLPVYGRTKLCNVLFANELARRLGGEPVTSNSLHPGSVRTEVTRDSFLLSLGIRIAAPFLKTAAEGAATSIRLATDPRLEGVTGGYFSDEAQLPPSDPARDQELARKLWEWSLEWVGLDPTSLASPLRNA